MLELRKRIDPLRQNSGAARRQRRGEKGGNRHPDRRQRRRQDHSADDPVWRAQAQQRFHLVRGEQIDSLTTARIMQGHRRGAGGRRIFARLTVEENLLMGPSSSTRRSSAACWIRFLPCSPPARAAGAAGRHHVRRRAADAGHRPRPDEQARRLLLLDEPSWDSRPSSSSRSSTP